MPRILTDQYAQSELSEGSLTRLDPWPQYAAAMRDHLAHNERLADRLRYYVADARKPPVDLMPNDIDAWLGLLRESEALASRHRVALESFRDATRS